jgi:two-component system, response regulator YesN
MSPDQTFNVKAFDYHPRLRKVRHYMENDCSRSLSLEDAAEIAGLETKYFGKYFRLMVGIGFKKWTTIFRIDVAIGIMETENQELTDIASAVGYDDYRTFERAFKKHTGLTPSRYRRVAIAKLFRVPETFTKNAV